MRLRNFNLYKTLLRIVLFSIIILMPSISANATSSYSGGAIIVNSGTNSIDNVYNDINNANYLSKSGSTYTLKVNMIVADGATLYVKNSIFQFNGEYRLWNKGGGTLIIDNSTITSVSSSAKGRILNRRLSGEGYWTFSLTNSTVNKLGPGGVDEYGEYRYGLFGYPAQSDGNVHAASSPIITNNDFSDLDEIVFGNVGYDVIVTHNNIHDVSAQFVTQIQYGIVSYNNFYNNNGATNLIYTYGAPLISNNNFYNNIVIGSGAAIGQKEGNGGAIIENNTIDNIVGGYGIYILGSTHSNWGAVRNNIITNSNIAGIMVQGNAYVGGYDVLMVIENNTLDGLNGGILFSGNSNMGTNKAPKHVITRNNIIKNSGYGYWVNGYEFLDVISNNDSMIGNTEDLHIGDTMIDNSYPPFINPQYSTIAIKTSSTLFKDYKYLDLKVIDTNVNPIQGASVTITNTVDTNYPTINIDGQTKTSFTTGSDGHTPLPSNPANSAAILDFYKTSSTQQEMSYTITATYNGYTNSTTVSPTTSWYRSNPNTYQNTVVITLPITVPSTVATPEFSPPGGTYTSGQTVTITTNTSGATIHYTRDGSDPTESTPTYSTPLSITTTTTIKAKAWKAGLNPGSMATVTYTILTPILTSLTVSPSATSTAAGNTKIFTAQPRDQFGNTMPVSVAWSSSNSTVGTIDPTGVFTPKTQGTATITAANGSVSATAIVTVLPLAVVPTAPQNLQATAGDSKVQLSWGQPASDGGSAITNYRIYRSTSIGNEVFLKEAGSVLLYTESTVENGVKYYYKISAVNNVGEGSKSYEASATPFLASYYETTIQSPGNITDNRLRESAPGNIFGADGYIDIGQIPGVGRYRDVILFNLSMFNNANIINRATLSMVWYYSASTRGQDTIVEVYRPDTWYSNNVSWNNWITPGGSWYDKNNIVQGNVPYASLKFTASALPDNRYYDLDVTELVQGYVNGAYDNTGFFLKAKDENDNYIAFYSSDWTNASQRPRLDINYTTGSFSKVDLNMIALHLGEITSPPYPGYDLNADGTVNVLDAVLVAKKMI